MRAHRESLVTATNLQTSEVVTDFLPAIIAKIRRELCGWAVHVLMFDQQLQKPLCRPEDYDYLLKILRHEVDRSEADDLHVDYMYMTLYMYSSSLLKDLEASPVFG